VADQAVPHVPVLVGPLGEFVAPIAGEVVCDATVGLGGHSRIMAEAIGRDGTLIGLDVDASNLAVAEEWLSGVPCRVVLRRENFAKLDEVLESVGVERVDVILADLGVSSTQLDNAGRGFSFRRDGPLDMRMDDRLTTTASDMVNSMRENELSDVIYFNSQERFSRRIAKRICASRRDKRITTTSELSRVVCDALGVSPESRKSKIHPATRVFQALRIAINDEVGALASLLEKAPSLLNPGGRIGIIAFHSVEDGPVKRDFRRRKSEGLYEILTKRPVVAEADEREANPRSRSAKLRVARRTSESLEPRVEDF